MNKFICLIFSLIISFQVSSQDSLWKQIRVDENLTLSLPGKPVILDTTMERNNYNYRFLFYKLETPFSILTITATPTETGTNVNNSESLKKALDELTRGTCASAEDKGLTCVSTDTILNNIPGKKFRMYHRDPGMFLYFFAYSFILNDKMYSFTTIPIGADSTNVDFRNETFTLLRSIHFKQNEIKEQEFNSKAESTAYKMGEIFGYVVIGALLFYFVRKIFV